MVDQVDTEQGFHDSEMRQRRRQPWRNLIWPKDNEARLSLFVSSSIPISYYVFIVITQGGIFIWQDHLAKEIRKRRREMVIFFFFFFTSGKEVGIIIRLERRRRGISAKLMAHFLRVSRG